MTTRELPAVIAVGASAGGVEALSRLVALLPGDLPAPVLVVLHLSPSGTTVLPDILDRRSALRMRAARDGDPLEAGCGYVAPTDVHLTVEAGHVRLTSDPPEHGHRPAFDPLLRAVASVYGSRAVGVVLSGAQDDGARGLAELRAAGGTAIVQDPAEALYPSMSDHARVQVPDAEVLDLQGIAERLVALCVKMDAR